MASYIRLGGMFYKTTLPAMDSFQAISDHDDCQGLFVPIEYCIATA